MITFDISRFAPLGWRMLWLHEYGRLCASMNCLQPFLLCLFGLESHLQQHPLPAAITTMTSPVQAAIPDSSAALPSQTQTSSSPMVAQTARASSGTPLNQAQGSLVTVAGVQNQVSFSCPGTTNWFCC